MGHCDDGPICDIPGCSGKMSPFYKRRQSKKKRRASRVRASGYDTTSVLLDYFINPGEWLRLRFRDYDWIVNGRAPLIVHTYVEQTFIDMPKKGHREFPDPD